MSDSTVRTDEITRNLMITDYDYAKIFLFDNSFRRVVIKNATGTAVEIKAGQLIGQVSGNYQVYKSGTSNISFVGIAAETVTVEANDTVGKTVTICIAGKIAEDQLVFNGSDTLATVVAYIPIRDRIASDAAGIILKAADELTAVDN